MSASAKSGQSPEGGTPVEADTLGREALEATVTHLRVVAPGDNPMVVVGDNPMVVAGVSPMAVAGVSLMAVAGVKEGVPTISGTSPANQKPTSSMWRVLRQLGQ